LTLRRALAAGLAIGALLLNLAIEHVLTAARGSLILVAGLLDYSPTLNRGVSFGLFRQDGDRGRFILIAALILLSALVAFLAWRSANRLQAAAYGLVLGGALGNLVDRGLGGAVFDYLFLHLGPIPLFVCNFSDIVISAGVLLLAADALWSSRPSSPDN